MGRARGFLPYVGIITIFMNEYPKVKVMLERVSNKSCSNIETKIRPHCKVVFLTRFYITFQFQYSFIG